MCGFLSFIRCCETRICKQLLKHSRTFSYKCSATHCALECAAFLKLLWIARGIAKLIKNDAQNDASDLQSEAIRVGKFVQTNRWHKQQSVTRSTDEVRTAWGAISLCRQMQSHKLFRVANPDTRFAADNISAASQEHQLVTKMMLRICNPKQYELGICNPLNNHRVAKTSNNLKYLIIYSLKFSVFRTVILSVNLIL